MRLRTLICLALLLGPTAGMAQEAGDGAAGKAADSLSVWGAKRSFGRAVGEVALINATVWTFNEFVRGGNFTQVNPRTWWTNISNGFFFDDNTFTTNLFAHPYHGSLYYSAGRSNGLSYWEAAPFAIMGSLFWECCGESHPPAWNDWMATGLGGIAIGEVLYRASSSVLDNEAQGVERFGREAAAFAINPVRGFNRLLSGRSGRVSANPPSPYDKIPPHLANFLRAGYRHVNTTTSVGDNDAADDFGAGFLEFEMRFGDPWLDTRREPFDQFRMGLTVNFKDKETIGAFRIVGNLYSSDLKKSESAHHVFAVTQNFEYTNNTAVEFGGQSFGAGVLSNWKLADALSLQSDVNLHGYTLNSVNSEYAFTAEIPDRERLREYDMGIGAGSWLNLGLVRGDHELLGVGYRVAWIHTLNGSNTNGGDSNHIVQTAYVRGALPVFGRLGVGADATGWKRNSTFNLPGFADVEQRIGELRLYGWLRTF